VLQQAGLMLAALNFSSALKGSAL